jgi:hypothetical protein
MRIQFIQRNAGPVNRIVAACLVLLLISASGFSRQVNGKASQTPKQDPNAVAESDTPRREGLPFRIELGEGISQSGAEVVLAVMAVTVFHCPEPPMQVLIGDTTGLGIVESVDGHARSDFYLRPTKAGIRTNMWIEMPSATVHVAIRTVAVKGGAAAGDYHGEVFVRLPGFREKAESTRARVEMTEKELAECLIRQEKLKRQMEEERRRTAAETEAFVTDEALSVLASASFGYRRDSKAVRIGAASVKQVGSLVRIGTRRFWTVLEIENRDKRKTLWVQELSSSEGIRVRIREGRLPPIEPKKRMRFGVMIEQSGSVEPQREALMPKLSLIIEGVTGVIALQL